jgi:hypothetical protein
MGGALIIAAILFSVLMLADLTKLLHLHGPRVYGVADYHGGH